MTVRRRSEVSSRRSIRPASANCVATRLAVVVAHPSRWASWEIESGPCMATMANAVRWRGARTPSSISAAQTAR